jgi:hypothetical protein
MAVQAYQEQARQEVVALLRRSSAAGLRSGERQLRRRQYLGPRRILPTPVTGQPVPLSGQPAGPPVAAVRRSLLA